MKKGQSKHRYIAVKILGRDLLSNEIVHHINGKNTDNRIFNLCVMDRLKHEHFHAWLLWNKNKKGGYPRFIDQQKVLESEYGAVLLAKIEPRFEMSANENSNNIDTDIEVDLKKSEVNNDNLILVRRNKISKELFIEFEEEKLIGPNGNVIDIDVERFSDSFIVTTSDLTKKQLHIYYGKLKSADFKVKADEKRKNLQKILFSELKKERLKIAKEINKPAFIVLHDSALIEIAEVMPISKSLLQQIEGIGPDKMRMYGDRFLEVIRNFKIKYEKESA